jgi:hypothetical protein
MANLLKVHIYPGFSSNCFRKIEAHAKVRPAMTTSIDSARPTHRRTTPGSRAHALHLHCVLKTLESGQKKKWPWGSAQPIEKARFGQGNARESKPFSLIVFARLCPGFAGFC